MSSLFKSKKSAKEEDPEICLPRSRIQELFENGHQHLADDASPWRLFRIMAEFVDGFEFLNKFKARNAVTFYGTARCGFGHELYHEATRLAHKLSKDNFVVITGGGPGIMEAANKGAYQAGGESVGLNIKLPSEQSVNKYVKEYLNFKHFYVRRVMLAFASEVYVFFPGGFGTLDEFYELITLIQTKKIKPIPVIIIGKEFWQPLIDWMKEYMYRRNHAVNQEDFEIFHLVDGSDEAYELIHKLLKPKK